MTDKAKFELVGVKQLIDALRAVGPGVAKRAGKTGVRKAAVKMRTHMRQSAPRINGNLRKSLKYKAVRRRDGTAVYRVGLFDRWYYKTLDMETRRGPPMNPWMLKAIDRNIDESQRIIITESIKAVNFEAGKQYAKNKAAMRGLVGI
ncbi:hypothetical protein DRH27_00540 [Candidatus Falkowbacteria bacterium]|nr:MAG: hypothetical protein DRH27_00540 [Candidatus Falkowbacteria bacterium]